MEAAFFTKLFARASKGTKNTWIIQTNDAGQAVVYYVPPDGGRTSMTCGSIDVVILDALAEQFRDYSIHNILNPGCPLQYGFRQSRWRDVVATLNSRRSSAGRAHARACFEVHYWSDMDPMHRYLSCKSHYRRYPTEMTPAATEYDAEADRKSAVLDELHRGNGRPDAD